ncbi:GvpL/GvpF family gas vesicle protein [Streptomyces sp. NPDC056524]|uniref:GvpL/GvpF family gas vesicle protein n=1 Tax=Streptomyces sp. NPDC056524 TaxID=3345851 RepID=UPI003687CAA0
MSELDLNRDAVGSPAPGAHGLPRSEGAPASPPMAYVYGVGRDDGSLSDLVRTVSGVDGHRVGLVPADGLVALVSAVPADVFDDTALRQQLEDLGRLEGIARAHHDVVDAAFTQAAVLPCRLATVCHNEGQVVGMLVEHRDWFAEMLTCFDGHVELGVKVHADPKAVAAPPQTASREPAGTRTTSPGRAYLQQRRQRRRSTEDLFHAAGAVVDDVTTVAQQLARATVMHRPQEGGLSGQHGVNIANHAYLVPSGTEARFRDAVRAATRSVPGVRVEVTGPWAPYSFSAPTVATDMGASAGGDGSGSGDGSAVGDAGGDGVAER